MEIDKDKIPVLICQMRCVHGYILADFFEAQSIRSKLNIVLCENHIIMENSNVDKNFSKNSYLKGIYIELKWNNIQKDKRMVTLCYDTMKFKKLISGIQKKDTAYMYIAQIRDPTNEDKFDEEGSSNEFAIYVGKEENDMECYKWVPATRTEYVPIPADDPGNDVEPLYIPLKQYRELLKDLTKLKNQEILIRFHEGSRGKGIEIKLSGNRANTFYKKFGQINDDNVETSNPVKNLSVRSDVVILNNDKKVEIEVIPPNEYRISSDKMIHLFNIAFHNEGGVLMYYKSGHNLKLTYEAGCYSVDNTYISNNSTKLT